MYKLTLRLGACALGLVLSCSFYLSAFAMPSSPIAVPRIVQPIDASQRVTLQGNVRPEAIASNDAGAVADDLVLDHMFMQLVRAPERETALTQFMAQQLDVSSPNYHQWLTADQFGQLYGPAQSDIDTITGWLESQGFTVNRVYESGMMIDFTGTAAQVSTAFNTEIHNLNVDGQAHIANMSAPQIPAALAPVINGVVSLHDFRPHTNFKPRPEYTYVGTSKTYHAIVPEDLATIYNLNPLINGSPKIDGTGQTIVLIEDTNVHSLADISTFRSIFGLPATTLLQVQPSGCTSPGDVAGNDGEAELDIEWAGAAAPGATLELASCKDTTTFGGLIAMQNLINASSTPPAIMSVSYGECEAANGASANAAYVSTYQQAATEGVSVFVSSGDEGAASCDANATKATHGIGVSGFASTPYNVAVGGTDYSDTYSGTTATYWNASNDGNYGSALSYIPETPWNDSCANTLLTTFNGFSVPYGTAGFCNSSGVTTANYLTTGSGSGGPSGCATGSASTAKVVSGTCAGTAKPSWQANFLGNPNDSVRDIPDVSLFAANGVWGHYYVYCYTGTTANGGAPCTGLPSTWSGAGGTSFSSPILAAMQALVNQKTGSRTGNPNPTYYQLAAAEYGATGSTSCNSSNGVGVGSSCIFYDVTLGDLDVNCTGTHNCYLPSGTNGVLSTSTSSYVPAYGTNTGWDFSTGIGTVNATNLVNNWPLPAGTAATKLIVTTQPSSTYAAGATITIKVSLENASGTVITTDTSAVTLAFASNPGSATLGGTLTANAVAGVATFSNLTVNKTGTGYTLTATDGSLTSATTTAFNITAGTATKLVYTTTPPASSAAGAAFGAVVSVEDANGNIVTGNTSAVTVALSGGTSGASLTGTATVNAVSGVATFSGLSVNKVGTSYTLTATDSGLTSATSNFNITAGAATKLVYTTTPPASFASGLTFGAVLSVEDANGNVVTGNTSAVTVALSGGTSGASLSGTTTVSAVNGVATFGGLSVDKVGTGYTLTATDSGLTSATSNFNITAGTAAKLVYTTTPPASSNTGVPFGAVVSVEDANGNVVTGNTSAITVALSGGSSGASLSGTTTVSAVNGVATFSGLSVGTVGTAYVLTATDTGLSSATSNFDITAGGASQLVYSLQPPSSIGSSATFNVAVSVQDAADNVVTTDTSSVTLQLSGGTAGATLSGTLTAAVVNGVANFSGLSVDKAGTTYTLIASDGSLSGATSNTFVVTAGTATQLVFTAEPGDVQAGTAINNPNVAVSIEDASGNVINDSSTPITLSVNACGSTVLATITATNGTAVFPGTVFYTPVNGDIMTATAGALSVNSVSFDILQNTDLVFADGFEGCRP